MFVYIFANSTNSIEIQKWTSLHIKNADRVHFAKIKNKKKTLSMTEPVKRKRKFKILTQNPKEFRLIWKCKAKRSNSKCKQIYYAIGVSSIEIDVLIGQWRDRGRIQPLIYICLMHWYWIQFVVYLWLFIYIFIIYL